MTSSMRIGVVQLGQSHEKGKLGEGDQKWNALSF